MTKIKGPLHIGLDASMLSERRTGIGNYVFNLLTQMTTLGADVRYYLYSDRALAADCHGFGAYVEHIGPPINRGGLWMSTSLAPYLKRDEINVFWGGNGYLPLWVPAGVATVVTIHDLVYHYSGQTMPLISRWARRILQPLAVRQATAVVAVSNSTGEQIRQHYRRVPDAIVHPRMDARFLKPASAAERAAVLRKYNLPERFFFSLGTMEPRKNLRSLLTAYAAVKAQLTTVPPLILAGNRGWLDDEIYSDIERLAVDGSVRWLGFVSQEDMPALYAACELFVFVPTYEGFGMPVREALLAGASVMASDIPALREAGGDFPLYTAPNVAAITQTLRHYLVGGCSPARPGLGAQVLDVGSASTFLDVLLAAAMTA